MRLRPFVSGGDVDWNDQRQLERWSASGPSAGASGAVGTIAVAGAARRTTTELLVRVLCDRRFVLAGGSERSPAAWGVVTALYRASGAGAALAFDPARRAAEIVESLRADGQAVLDGDDSLVRRLGKHCPAAITWVGTSTGCHLRASRVSDDEFGQLRCEVDGRKFLVRGCEAENLSAALAAIAVGRLAGLDDTEIGHRLADGEPQPAEPARLRLRVAGRGRRAEFFRAAHGVSAASNRAA